MDPDHADDKFGQDQAQTHMVKLVDGKLVPTADTESISPDDLTNQYANDEEQGLNAPNHKTYDRVDVGRNDDDQDQIQGQEGTQNPTGEMIPATPDPNNPIPAAPETPSPPAPVPAGPEIPDLPGESRPDRPEITEPSQPGRSHEINNQGGSN